MKMSLFNIEIYLKKCHFHKRANAPFMKLTAASRKIAHIKI